MSQPLLSLCMIVRDEEASIDRALESAAPFVDETIVVDTGSVDRTVELAEAQGARVLQEEWNDDYAAARNRGLDAAAGSFILVLDADEWIEAGSHPQSLRALLEGTEEDLMTVELAERLDGGRVQRRAGLRLFRNRPSLRYVGAFGEQLPPENGDTSRLRPSGLEVAHEGRLLSQRIGQGRERRHLDQLRRMIERNPDDAASRFLLASRRVCIHDGRVVPGAHLQESLELLRSVQDRPGSLSIRDRRAAARLHAAALLALDAADAAVEILDSRPEDGLEWNLLRADAEMMQASEEETAPGPELALERLGSFLDGPIESDDETLVRARSSEALLLLGRITDARTMAEKACAHRDAGASGWCALASVAYAEGKVTEAMQAYIDGLRSDATDPWAWAGLGALLLSHGKAEEALEPLKNAAVLAPGWDAVDEALATAMLIEDQAAEMIEMLEEADERRLGPGAQAGLILACAANGESSPLNQIHPDASEAINRILGGLASAGRRDLLERLAHGLREGAVAAG